MIKIFKKDETNFSHDGLEVLDDIVISSYTEWSEESKWIIQAKFKKDFDKSESIKEGLIIQVPTEKGDQLFRILKINKKNRKYISISGHAIGYDFNDNFIQDINIVEKSGRVAMQQISNGTVYPHRYNLTSNIDRVASARIVRKNGMEALINTDKDNTFVERWGGCLVLDNFDISMNEAVGQDRGVEISIGKNITGYDGDIDEETVCTGINAITYDGLTLPEGVYYSPLVNNYPHPKIREFKFDNIKYKHSENNYDKEGYETLDEVYAAIRKACDDLFNTQNIDKPTCSLRVNIAALENTDQYKGDELNERIFQGDILTANLEDYGFNVKLKMVANRYDNIRNRYIDIDLGDAKNNLFKDIGKIEVVIDKVVEQLGGNTWQDILDKSMQEAADLIAAGIKDSYVVARKNEILIMDSPQVESAINVIRMNKNGIAFSRSGYNGPYTLAITIDGKINASCITTGQLNAALIKTGTLMSANGTTWIDMENGTFSFANKIKFDGSNFDIDLSNKGLATDGDIKTLQTQITANADGLKSKVSSGDVSSIIQHDSESVKIGFNGISDTVYFAANGMILKGDSEFWGVIKSVAPNGNYAELRPVLVDGGHISYQMWLGSSQSDFRIKWNGGSEMAYFGAGGFQTDNNVTFRTNQTGPYNTTCYWENGTYRPKEANKALIGTNNYYFNTVYSRWFGRERSQDTYTTLEAGNVNIRTMYNNSANDNGILFTYNGYMQPASNLAWACGSPSNRFSTVYANKIDAPSDLQLKENVRYLLKDEPNVVPYNLNNSDLTTQDLYEFTRDSLKLAEFNYIEQRDDEKSNSIGFIAQDIVGTKVGDKLLKSNGDVLSYDLANYISITVGALQKAIEKIEILENKINAMEGGV